MKLTLFLIKDFFRHFLLDRKSHRQRGKEIRPLPTRPTRDSDELARRPDCV